MSNNGQSTRDAYLESCVQTATPQKLHLLLIDGAIRFALQAKRHVERDETLAAATATDRCRKVVAEMLASVRAEDSEISKNLADIYLFLYRTLVDVRFQDQTSKMDEVLQVLQIERETWSQVCQKHGSKLGPESKVPPPRALISQPAPLDLSDHNYGPAGPGFSLEA